MNLTVSITNSNIEDLSEIFKLYSLATEFQKIKLPGNCWPRFEEKLMSASLRPTSSTSHLLSFPLRSSVMLIPLMSKPITFDFLPMAKATRKPT